MTTLDTYLFFDGNCAEAMRFYEKTLGGKLEAMMTQAEAPAGSGMPPGSPDRIMHASLLLGDRRLMASDTMAGQPYAGMHGFSLSLSCPTAAEGKKLFDALSAGGKVTMPMGPTFWIESFGMLVDGFGTSWMINAGASKMG
jgi:PhnB protein